MPVAKRLALAAVLCLAGCAPPGPTPDSRGEALTTQAASYSSGSASPPDVVHCTTGNQSSWTTYAECNRNIVEAMKKASNAAQPERDASVLTPTPDPRDEAFATQAASYSSGSASPPDIVHCTIGEQSSLTTPAECNRNVAEAMKRGSQVAQPPPDVSVCDAPPYGSSMTDYDAFLKKFGSGMDTDSFLQDACKARHRS
jgi:hypothetical protein